MATVDLYKIISGNSYVSHLILDGKGDDNISKMVMDRNYSIEKAELVVTINGFEINTVILEDLLKDWTDLCVKAELEEMAQAERRIDTLQTEEGLMDKAKELAKQMCYDMAQKFEWGE